MKLTLNHLSITQINAYLRCPLSYYFRYIEGIKIPPAGAIILGKSIHKTLEENYRQKIKSFKDLPLNQILEIYSASFEKQKKEEPEIDWEGENPGKVKDDGIGLLKVYQKEISPNIQPLLVEEPFTIEFRNTNYLLVGFWDLIDRNQIIRDTKTAKRSYPEDAAENSLQLTAYQLAYEIIKRRKPKALILDVMVRNKTPKTQVLISPPRNEIKIKRFLKTMSQIAHSVETGIFYPCEDRIKCSYCGYKELCKKW